MTLINDEEFSDVYITPQKEAFIWSRKTPYGLRPVVFDDYEEFLAEVEKGYEGEPSYLIIYKSYNYRVERTNSLYGVQYCVRKMPRVVPDFKISVFRRSWPAIFALSAVRRGCFWYRVRPVPAKARLLLRC